MPKKTETAVEKKPVEKQLTATQKIERLEGAVMNAYQTMDNMARDLLMLKDAVKLLGNKVASVVTVVNDKKELTDENIAKQMVQNNIDELAEKVKDLETKGVLVKTEALGDHGFIVGRELTSDNKVVNPRLQFVVAQQPQNVQEKLKGAKSGEVISLEEGKAKLEVLETYTIKAPQSAAPAPAPAAPAN